MRLDMLQEWWTSLKRPGLFARNVSITFASQILVLVMGVIYTGLVGRGLGSEGKGVLEVAIVLPAMLGLFFGGGVNVANIYFAGTKRLTLPVLTAHSVSFMLCTVVLSVVVTGLLAAAGLLERLLPNIPLWIIFIMLISLPFELLYIYWRAILQGSNQIVAANVVGLIKVVVLLVLTLIAIFWQDWGLDGAVAAWISAAIISIVPLIFLLRQQGASFWPRWDLAIMRQMLHFGLRGYLGNLLQFFNYRLDLLIVNFFVGAAAVGIYSVSTRMAETLWFLPSAVGFVIMPKAASTSAKKMNQFTPVVFALTMLVTLVGALFLVILGRPFIRIIFGDEFMSAYVPLLILLPGVVLLGGGKVLTNEITGRGYPQYNAIGSGLALVITIILDVILIPRWGIVGAAAASSVAYSLVFFIAVGFYMLVRRQTVTAVAVWPDAVEEMVE